MAQTRNRTTLAAWGIMLLASLLPDIIWQEVCGQQWPWLAIKGGILVALLAVGLVWPMFKQLRPFIFILLLIYAAEYLFTSQMGSAAWWPAVLARQAPFAGQMLGIHLQRLAVALAVMGGMLLLGTLNGVIPPRQALLLTSVFFGLAHYYGVPYGILGVVMSTFLGWILGKAMLETRGFFWAWFIHFCQNVAIFSFMASGARNLALAGGRHGGALLWQHGHLRAHPRGRAADGTSRQGQPAERPVAAWLVNRLHRAACCASSFAHREPTCIIQCSCHQAHFLPATPCAPSTWQFLVQGLSSRPDHRRSASPPEAENRY